MMLLSMCVLKKQKHIWLMFSYLIMELFITDIDIIDNRNHSRIISFKKSSREKVGPKKPAQIFA